MNQATQLPWIEWLGHSNFSFLTGAAHPAEMVEQALACGYQGLGLADFDGLYGSARAWRALADIRRERPPVNFRLFFGAEIHLGPDHHRPLLLQDTLVLYAMNTEGYHQLCRLISLSHRLGEGKGAACLSLEQLCQHPTDHIAAIKPMRGLIRQTSGELTDALLDQTQRLKDHFGERFFLALSRHLHPAEDRYLAPTLALGRKLQVPFLCAQDAFFDRPEKKDLVDLLWAIRENQPVSQIPGHLLPNNRRCLHSKEELYKLYAEMPEFGRSVQNSLNLASQIQFDLSELRYHYPQEMIPAGMKAQEYLEQLARCKAQERQVSAKVRQQIENELELIQKLNFADYFLTVYDIVDWAKSQQILCQGSGSAANSAVCYVLGITAVDPANFDLLFERFISLERGDPPDIDVDFENDRREEVLQYVYRRYGRERAAMVCNVVTFRGRGALRATGKALGIPETLLQRAAKRSKTLEFRGQDKASLLMSLKGEWQAEGLSLSDRQWFLWASMSERLKGYPRHLSIHSGGFVLSDQPIDALVPQEPATMVGRTVIQWSKDDLEALGFFKIDLLALGMLSAMRRTFDFIAEQGGPKLGLKDIPQGDRATYQMICEADTVGVFQIESAAQRASLATLAPQKFYDLVVQVAIIRPGPILAGVKHPYLKRRAGLEPVTYPHPLLEPILQRTYGTIIFQEQLMRVAMAVGNFTAGEADMIRKSIGGFSSTGNLSLWIHKLIEGMVQNGIAPKFIEEVIQQIQGFSSYGFPESHAASFAMIAYGSSWLKCHHPVAFFAGLLNSQPMGFYSSDTLIKTAIQSGVTVLPVCINRSQLEAMMEVLPEPAKAQAGQKTHAIRLGFNQIKGLSEETSKQIVSVRPAKGWSKLEGFLSQVSLAQPQVSALAAANSLAVLGSPRRDALWRVEAPLYSPQRSYLKHLTLEEPTARFAPETEMEAVEQDYRATRTSLGRHLSDLIKEQAWVYPVPLDQTLDFKQIKQASTGSTIWVFGMVLVKQSPGTAKGMLFITLEDGQGTLQVAVTPQTYAQYARLIDQQLFLCLQGRLQQRDGNPTLLVQQVYDPDFQLAPVLTLKARQAFEPQNIKPYKGVRSYM